MRVEILQWIKIQAQKRDSGSSCGRNYNYGYRWSEIDQVFSCNAPRFWEVRGGWKTLYCFCDFANSWDDHYRRIKVRFNPDKLIQKVMVAFVMLNSILKVYSILTSGHFQDGVQIRQKTFCVNFVAVRCFCRRLTNRNMKIKACISRYI